MSSKDVEELCNYTVDKSNDLIRRSRYSLPVVQQKMLVYLISRIGSRTDPDQTMIFDVHDFCITCGLEVKSGFYYSELKKQLKELADSSAWIQTSDNPREYQLFRWLDEVKIHENDGKISVTFHNSVKPYLFAMQGHFTKYKLSEVLPFRSKYSIRLYEYLKSFCWTDEFKNGDEITISIAPDDLKIRIDAENYETYRDIKSRVIKPAVAEINKFSSDIHVDFLEVKQGRKIVRIDFVVDKPHSLQQQEAPNNRDQVLDRHTKQQHKVNEDELAF